MDSFNSFLSHLKTKRSFSQYEGSDNKSCMNNINSTSTIIKEELQISKPKSNIFNKNLLLLPYNTNVISSNANIHNNINNNINDYDSIYYSTFLEIVNRFYSLLEETETEEVIQINN